MKRRIFMLMAALTLTVNCLWCKDDEVIVTRQLTMSQRNALPEKTINVETRRLMLSKKADPGLSEALLAILDTIAGEDYLNRTFVLRLEPKAGGEVEIAVHSDDIVSRGRRDATIYYGTIEHKRYHFVVLTSKDNPSLLDQTFKRQGKVRFVQEFEFVDFPTPPYPTTVISRWSPAQGLSWHTVMINDDRSGNMDLSSPAQIRD